MAGIRNDLEGRFLMQAVAPGLPPSLPLCASDEGKKLFFLKL